MSSRITSDTLVRKLNHSTLRTLSDFLDPQDAWKAVLVDIKNDTGEPRYTQLHLRRFERLVAQGKSPTVELLNDWGTTNCRVGELVGILLKHTLIAPATVLLPDMTAQASVSANWTAVKCPLPEYHQQQTQPCGTRLNKSPAEEDTWYTEPGSSTGPEEVQEPDEEGFYRFTYHELTQTTDNWNDHPVSAGGNRLGEGGFGIVFKGLLASTPVAIKKLHLVDDMPPDELKTQFEQELQTLKRLHHINLVNMVGYSTDGQYPCLVYAFMCNGSLLDRLACLEGSEPLSWQFRCTIARGTARGLEYLHHNNHIHRDVKSGNILLDESFIPKISDFGLTRASTKQSCSTMITERIMGTTAYMAPEALRGEITPKSDVFSFGVVLLEILSGLPPVDENRDPKLLLEMTDEIEEEEMTLAELVDTNMPDCEPDAVKKMYSVACQCLNRGKNRRPVFKEVLAELEELI